MSAQPFYQPAYLNSHALVVGIDKYKHVGPLAYAGSDATAVASALEHKLHFPAENITLLLDGKATRSAITSAYLRLSDPAVVGPDDRVFVFFAGHGHTVPGRRGETGFLVPVDGDVSDLATLVKWSELTGSADLIAAKHVFFLMDACYGGLAITRRIIPPGSMRLLEDMLQRFSRQVLTAGKADEPVSDGGGTRPGHSIFTSHVLDALDGAASATEGVITANGVMAYVYDKVGNDPLSHQTPHYGFLEGDGDFIFTPLIVATDGEEKDEPILIQTPSFSGPQSPPTEAEPASEKLKRLIADPADKIRLDDLVSAQLRHAVQTVGIDKFPMQGAYSNASIAERIKAYEDALIDLEATIILLARWAREDQLPIIGKLFARLAETNRNQSGLVAWINLGWYPLLLLMYAGGISALSERRFDSLKACLLTLVASNRHGDTKTLPIIIPTILAVTDVHDCFKVLPGLENRYTPRSDHLFNTLQPIIEDHLFLGQSYEALFDEFEIFLALTFADARAGDPIGRVWGPPGRFAWKRNYGDGTGPFAEIVGQAKREGANWPPLKVGLFGADIQRFISISDQYQALLSQLPWF
jgi:hypothetical protein